MRMQNCTPRFSCLCFFLKGMTVKKGLVILQVWSIEQPEWTCKIDEGSAGLCAVRWSPDGRHILTTADFNVGHTKKTKKNSFTSPLSLYIQYIIR